LALTHPQIAARIGTVREVVTRAFAWLQQHGLIILNGRHLTLPDEEALTAYAGEY